MQERRATTRRPCRVLARLTAGTQAIDGVLTDVGLGGAFVEAGERPPIGARVTVSFHVPAQPEAIEVGGEIRWHGKAPEPEGFGVRFDGLRARDTWALTRFLEAP